MLVDFTQTVIILVNLIGTSDISKSERNIAIMTTIQSTTGMGDFGMGYTLYFRTGFHYDW